MRFYREFFLRLGIRRLDMLANPPLTTLSDYEVPRDSAIHYLRQSTEEGPDANYVLLKGSKRGGWIQHVTELATTEGRPRYMPQGVISRTMDYHKSHPTLRLLRRDMETLTDGNFPLVINYAMLPDLYSYMNNQYTAWNRRHNLLETIVKHVNEVAEKSDKQQFILVEINEELPTYNAFLRAEDKLDSTTIKHFDTDLSVLLLEIWRWLGDKRSEGVLSRLSRKSVDYLNLVIVKNGIFTVLNLGLLDGWRVDPNDPDAERNGQKIDHLRLQKRLLGMLLAMGSGETLSGETEEVNIGDTAQSTKLNVAKRPKTAPKDDIEDEWLTRQEDTNPTNDAEAEIDETSTVHEGGNTHVDVDTAADDLLETHDRQIETAVAIENEGTYAERLLQVTPYSAPTFSYENAALKKAASALKQGGIGLPEYNRFQRLATKHRELNAPGTDQPIVEFAKVTTEMLDCSNPPSLPKLPGVVDASMLQSTHFVFNSKYINTVLDRDIAGAILAFQQTGCMVTDVKMTEFQDIGNHYREYSLSVEMVDGSPSTVKFKLPVFDENGVCRAGGVKYYLKMQKGEDPIRKSGPTRVALTSYYGKTFIDRSQNVVANAEQWLINQITKVGVDPDNHAVTHMRVGNAFKSTIKAPRVYSILSKRFISFNVNRVHTDAAVKRPDSTIRFDFNYKTRIETAAHYSGETTETLIAIEAQRNGIIVGTRSTDKAVITIGQDNRFYDGSESALGTIEEILGIDTAKKPIEMATMTVFNKNIPVGMVLGYLLGIDTLLKTLNVTPRVVPSGKTLNLQPNEFRIKFKDVSLIVDASDPKAAMILNGFNAHHKAIAEYPLEYFNKPDVYFNVLQTANLGVRYLREIANVVDCFIDNIARDRLIEMGEPTDMIELILRSCELLMQDYYNPSEGVRYRGYERVAGAVYSQLMLAHRKKQSKPFSNRSRLDINPEEVYMSIMMDSAMEVLNEINPIHNLKNSEVVTYGGTGGRSTKTMVKNTRGFQKGDLGVISEATVDSGDTGIITYTTANPSFVSLRGVTAPPGENDGAARFISSSACLSACGDGD